MRTFAVLACLALTALCESETKCPQNPHVNLIKNGNFERKGSLKPWRNFRGGRIVKPGDKSKQAWGGGSKVKESYPYIFQSFDACDKTYYVVSRDHRVKVGKTKLNQAYPQIGVQLGNTAEGPTFFKPVDQDYTHHESIHYLRSSSKHRGTLGPRLMLFGDMNRNEDFAFDNVKVHPLGPISKNPKAPEMVKNGGFESGKRAPWFSYVTNDKNCKVVDRGYKSKYSFFCSIDSGLDFSYYLQFVTLEPRKRYILSYDLRTTREVEKDDCTFEFDVGELSLGTIGPGDNTDFPAPNGKWKHFEIPIVADKRNASLEFTVQTAFGKGKCTWQIDNVSIKEAM